MCVGVKVFNELTIENEMIKQMIALIHLSREYYMFLTNVCITHCEQVHGRYEKKKHYFSYSFIKRKFIIFDLMIDTL